MKEEQKHGLWMRAGIMLFATEDEIKQIIEKKDKAALRAVLDRRDYEFDGETYIPWECMEPEDFPNLDISKIDEEVRFDL